ncbi:MAG: Hsp20/alpha crystallin family protein [Spirochaetales bacterium]|nr:Hsp20/alpha crystallin family protein [Spirochaetales bacterium]
MSLIKWKNRDLYNPWSEFKALQNEINDLFDMDRFPGNTGLFDRNFSPKIDVVENDQNFVVNCELPGLEQKDLDVSIASNVLTLKGTKKGHHEDGKKGQFYKKETWSGSFQRTLSLPTSVDANKIQAELKNGILTITLPKKEEAKAKQISVNVN